MNFRQKIILSNEAQNEYAPDNRYAVEPFFGTALFGLFDCC